MRSLLLFSCFILVGCNSEGGVVSPATNPTISPTLSPTVVPTISPTSNPTISPTLSPTVAPTISPTSNPTINPTLSPTVAPTVSPTPEPTISPTLSPTVEPTVIPSSTPNININPVTVWYTVMGSAYNFNASINNGSSRLTLYIDGLVNSAVSPWWCDLSVESVGSSSSCNLIITNDNSYAPWDTFNIKNSVDVNNPQIIQQSNLLLIANATNNATINNGLTNSFNIVGQVIAPYIYLPAVGEGDSSAAGTGITWGKNGIVSDRFIINDDESECVVDSLTGLMWSKNIGLLGTATWSSDVKFGSAQYKIYQMNNNPVAIGYKLCGYSDWRLPTINELYSLTTYQRLDEWLVTQGFTNMPHNNARYWSSTVYKKNPSFGGLVIPFYVPYPIITWAGFSTNYVLPVRGGI